MQQIGGKRIQDQEHLDGNGAPFDIMRDCFGSFWILWHIQFHHLLNAIYVCIRYIRFGLVWFNGISSIVGYLMPNLLYTCILDIKDLVWLGFVAYQAL